MFLLTFCRLRTDHYECQLQPIPTHHLQVYASSFDRIIRTDTSIPITRDATIVSLMDTFTSLLAGVTIFAILGNLAHESGKDITKVVQGGTGLAFISYPEAIAKFDVVPQLFAVLFFLMLFTLGIGSAVSLTGCVITVVCDAFPTWKRWSVTLVICSVGFLLGLVYVTPVKSRNR